MALHATGDFDPARLLPTELLPSKTLPVTTEAGWFDLHAYGGFGAAER